jgi:hypothetical protein
VDGPEVEGESGKRPERALGLDRVKWEVVGVVVRNRRVRVEGRRRVNMVEMMGAVEGVGGVWW